MKLKCLYCLSFSNEMSQFINKSVIHSVLNFSHVLQNTINNIKAVCMISVLIIYRFVGCLSRIDAENMLKDLPDGVFLIRESDQRKGEYAVGLR